MLESIWSQTEFLDFLNTIGKHSRNKISHDVKPTSQITSFWYWINWFSLYLVARNLLLHTSACMRACSTSSRSSSMTVCKWESSRSTCVLSNIMRSYLEIKMSSAQCPHKIQYKIMLTRLPKWFLTLFPSTLSRASFSVIVTIEKEDMETYKVLKIKVFNFCRTIFENDTTMIKTT